VEADLASIFREIEAARLDNERKRAAMNDEGDA
jgi:hypothetical protein